MKIGMCKDDIMMYLKKDKEASIYLDNVLKKYREEFSDFLDKVANIDIHTKRNDLEYQKELQKFVLELIIQRLRQLNCFGEPNKEYAKKVFETTLKDIV